MSDTEWILGADGLLEREAARIIILDPDGRLYLVLGHDSGDLQHRWWFTVGGGIGPGESTRQGAVRELEEETGLGVDPSRLVGPIIERTAIFHFAYEDRRQHEYYYVLTLSEEECERLGAGRNLTELEREVLDDFRWWDLDDLQTTSISYYPHALPDIVRSYLAQPGAGIWNILEGTECDNVVFIPTDDAPQV